MSVFNPELVFIGGRIQRNKSISVEEGKIVAIGEGDGSDEGLYLPGFVNAHSHAFQRGLRGRGEHFASGSDSFWGWREEMYRLVEELTVDKFYNLCVQCFSEMRETGITTVGEFHYVHHNAECDFAMDRAVLQAAKEVGIRIVLLHAFYKHGGFHTPLIDAQQRFSTQTLDQWWAQVDELASEVDGTMQRVGTVAHSVRAVDIDSIQKIAIGSLQRGMPMHIHLEEQRQEISDCISAHGVTPMAMLNDAIDVSPLVTAIHCTHTAKADMEEWISSGGNICLCPLTEANLADGVCDMHQIVKQGGCVSLGTDSNARISMLEEMRLMEYVQRVAREERGVCVDDSGSMSNYLINAATRNGARCLGFPSGNIEVGKYADFTVIDLKQPQLAGASDETLLSMICCGADNRSVKRTIVDGNP